MQTETSLLDRVRSVLQKVLNQLGEEMDLETSLVDDLLVVSHDLPELAVELEEEFNIPAGITTDELKHCKTVKDIIALIIKKEGT